jgi:hypothetical protein
VKLGQARHLDLAAPAQLVLHQRVQQLRLLAQQRGGAQHALLGRRVHRSQRGHERVAHARSRVSLVRVALVLAPSQFTRAAVGGGLLAREPQQRPDDPALPRGHSKQRTPTGRGGQTVEDRLHLIARGVPRSDQRTGVQLLRKPLRRAVAQLARPRLQVAGPALRALLLADAHQLEPHAQPLAQPPAVVRVGV